jgi:hypothetical protein
MRRIDRGPQPATRRRWTISVGVSLAASFLLALGWIAFPRHQGEPDTIDPATLVRSSSEWQTVSQRPITLEGDVPAREVSRQRFEHVVWTDPQRHATFERVVPREKATLITLESY